MPERVVVVGGGIVGCAIAAELARRRLAPVLIEAKGIASGVSGASLAAIVQHLAGPVDEVPFVIESAALWRQHANDLKAEVGLDIELDVCGHLRILEGGDGADASELERHVESERAAGLDVEMVDSAKARRLVPRLDEGVVTAASWCAGDAKLNALVACRALAAAAQRRGADLLVGERVLELDPAPAWRIRTERGALDADVVVLATGPWTSTLLAPLDKRLAGAIVPRRAECCATATLPPLISPVVSSVSVGISVGYTQLHQMRHGEILFNTVVDSRDPRLPDGDLDSSVDLGFLVASAHTLRRLLPSLEGVRVLRSWAACEGWTRDRRFLVGPVPGYDGLLVAAGDSGTGFLRAPLIARLVSQLIVGEQASYDLQPYSPAREELLEAA